MIGEYLSNFFSNYYNQYGRKFEWRNNRTPFTVYLSEILLQRTQADQVTPVYHQLVEMFDNCNSLLENFDDVKLITRSLGRFCRLDYFKSGLICIVNRYDGIIPSQREDLLSIPGIGQYICGAVRIFGHGLQDTIIDANIVRVLGRIYNLKINPETRRRKYFIELAANHVPSTNFVDYSYGILDFAAAICRARNPECIVCNLNNVCKFYASV